MQTLLDPFELVGPLPLPPVAMARPPSAIEIDIEEIVEAVETQNTSTRWPPSPDSSGRLRCWCSED
jgi:hypothetical protein